jgi:hypothetical protein
VSGKQTLLSPPAPWNGREKALDAQGSDQRGGNYATSRRRVSGSKRCNVQDKEKLVRTCIYGKRTRLHLRLPLAVCQQIDRAAGMGTGCSGLYRCRRLRRGHGMTMCHRRIPAGRATRKLALNALRIAHEGRCLRNEQSKQERRQHDATSLVRKKAHNHFRIRCSLLPPPVAVGEVGCPYLARHSARYGIQIDPGVISHISSKKRTRYGHPTSVRAHA